MKIKRCHIQNVFKQAVNKQSMGWFDGNAVKH